MSSVERNESGYVVTLSEEEAETWIDAWLGKQRPWNKWTTLIDEIAVGLRACQPPPPPRPGDAVQWRALADSAHWTPSTGDSAVYVLVEYRDGRYTIQRTGQSGLGFGSWVADHSYELRRDVRAGGGA